MEHPDIVAAEPDPAIASRHEWTRNIENPASANLDCGVDRACASNNDVASEIAGITGLGAPPIKELSGKQDRSRRLDWRAPNKRSRAVPLWFVDQLQNDAIASPTSR